MDDGDPGWRQAMAMGALGFIPPLGLLLARRNFRSRDGLVLLRGLSITFAVAIALVGVVVVILDRYAGLVASTDPEPLAVALVACGVVALVIVRKITPRLDASSPKALGAAYRNRFFLRMAAAESVSLLAFVAVILTAEPWLYPIGLVFTAVGFSWNAPTRTNLVRDQERLRDEGASLDLVKVLRSPQS